MQNKEFFDSRARMIGFSILTITLTLVFGGISLAMLFGSITLEIPMFILSLILTIVLIPVSIVLLKKATTNEPSVVISTQGIIINGYIPKIGFIPWEDIDGCIPYQINKQAMLGFILFDEDKYVNKFTGMNKKLLEANRGMGYPAINVSINNLKDKEGFFEALAEQNIGFYLEDERQA